MSSNAIITWLCPAGGTEIKITGTGLDSVADDGVTIGGVICTKVDTLSLLLRPNAIYILKCEIFSTTFPLPLTYYDRLKDKQYDISCLIITYHIIILWFT